MKRFLVLIIFCLSGSNLMPAIQLTESSFTQVINDVQVLSMPAKGLKAAKVSDTFKTPDLLQTGKDSLAELTAKDNTVTRIGANTVFSFEQKGRNIRLEKGSVLFHSPAGKGGGTIRTGGASASVLGTTIMVATTVDGGFKAIVLEGKGQVRLPNGDFRILKAGQLVFVLPESRAFGPLLNINLDKLVRGARLVSGFAAKLPSLEKIEVEVEKQNERIEAGHAEDTHLLVGNEASENEVEVVDDDFIERTLKETPAQIAARNDLEINSSQINAGHLFLEPFSLSVGGLSDSQFRGVVAKDITINTPLIDLTGLSIGYSEFDILATGKLQIAGSVTFAGNAAAPHVLELTGAEGIEIETDSVVTAQNLGDWHLDSPVKMDFEDVTFLNNDGGIKLDTAADLKLSGGLVSSRFIEAQAYDVDLDQGDLRLVAGAGAHQVSLTANNRLTIVDSDFSGLGASPMFLKAADRLEITNPNISDFGFINLSARTIILEDIDFPAGSFVELRSQNGLLAPNPNSGQPVQPGFVNYIDNVRYDGTVLTSSPHPNITISPVP